jgi:hypothetical protein
MDTCNNLINYFEEIQNQNPNYVIDNSIVHNGSSKRKDEAIFIDDLNAEYSYEINDYLNKALEEYVSYYDILQSNTDGVIRSVKQKLQKTPIGGGYHEWHYESASVAQTNRVAVWTIYLNDVIAGGETEFLYHSERHNAEQGKIVIFPANYIATHRGNPPISNEKYIVTGWYTLNP